jgi:hypothetical protein
MKRFFVLLTMLGMVALSLSSVSAEWINTHGPVPPECIPNPSIVFEDWGDNQVGLYYDPGLSTDCELYDPSNPASSSNMVVMWLHHSYRPEAVNDYDGDEWGYEFLLHDLNWSGEALEEASGGPYYNIGGGYDITGESIGEYHRYSLTVLVVGRATPDSDLFEVHTGGKWFYGPDVVQVSGVFSGRPGGVTAPSDPSHAAIVTPTPVFGKTR